jgi:hypothetical protein
MLDQLFNIVRQASEHAVVKNPEIPNEYNQDVMADATKTVAGGFQNILAGGGFNNILDLFRGGGNNTGRQGGIGGLLKNPLVTMMIGYFISKLVGKYKMSPASASRVANDVIPNTVSNLVQQVNDPNNNKSTLDGLINSLAGGSGVPGSEPLQNLLDNRQGGASQGIDLQELIGRITQNAQHEVGERAQTGGGGILNLIKGLIAN